MSAPSTLSLTMVHLRYQFLETVRIPIAVIGNMLFPALALFFFVVPQEAVARDAVIATTSVASLGLFAIISASMFTHGVGVAEDRAQPFDPYVRALPAGPVPRMVGRVGNGALFGLLGLLPLVVIGWLFTDATVTAPRLLAGLGVAVVAAVPFVLLGMAVGFGMPAKAAIAAVQVILFPLAFAGGLFMPPELFPDWMATFSELLPTRAGRDLLVGAVTGAEVYALAWPVLLAWTALFTALAVVAYRRDEGRRFR